MGVSNNYHPKACSCLSRQVASSFSMVLPFSALQPRFLAPALCQSPAWVSFKWQLKQRCRHPICQVFKCPQRPQGMPCLLFPSCCVKLNLLFKVSCSPLVIISSWNDKFPWCETEIEQQATTPDLGQRRVVCYQVCWFHNVCFCHIPHQWKIFLWPNVCFWVEADLMMVSSNWLS